MTREAWKAYYRIQRIIRRETTKAALDMMVYGAGFVYIGEAGFVNHILPQAVYPFEGPDERAP